MVMGIVGFAAFARRPSRRYGRARPLLSPIKKRWLLRDHCFERKSMTGLLCIPVDSEHNALNQLLEGRERADVTSMS